ncbi:zinc finger, C3HC4 type (RING finger) domain-containing protein [Toxoplasma gondii ME49]|uniref:Zinc finger, C3HC4 type (RING finger) domain-containing protein n=4 Tax=Toxoplasma gondii TaxID=5811 RepID=A0A086JHT2_TOXGO|nr:zinc finger, C3HC4 type (RING finger) domain-containing protein [Toxoplasma gondii ME49]EPT26650.1 zinc finger, C3HC4 type (RING finger) domain-containing protein [Toxoplasma gondii ME49]KFG31700.1 zinc finger, C3HC4 type (RING finger) domain-containing protein [Toxoplasma gondii GAB2-2007-GAL-DOM2]|eukprot:XP_002369031.1 zinc finger, C3HC4 type (RING finger) domain-containing protein [Toxoplasma gondii ME49]
MRADAAEFYPASHPGRQSPASASLPGASSSQPAAAPASQLAAAPPPPSSSASASSAPPCSRSRPARSVPCNRSSEKGSEGVSRPSRGVSAQVDGRSQAIPAHRLFSYKMYQKPSGNPCAARGGGDASKGNWRSSMGLAQQQVFAKERFVLANCRVFVSSEEDAKETFYNPDALVDWSSVVRVEMSSSAEDPITCPFCLEQPEAMLAPAVTKCGHIFCTPCILRYFDVLSEQQGGKHSQQPGGRYWQRCPLCFEPVARKDLRPARVYQVVPPRVGARATFCLLSRPLGSTVVSLASPVTHAVHAVQQGDAWMASQLRLTGEKQRAPPRGRKAADSAPEGGNGEPQEGYAETVDVASISSFSPSSSPFPSSLSARGLGAATASCGECAEMKTPGSAADEGHLHAGRIQSFLPHECPACKAEEAARQASARSRQDSGSAGACVPAVSKDVERTVAPPCLAASRLCVPCLLASERVLTAEKTRGNRRGRLSTAAPHCGVQAGTVSPPEPVGTSPEPLEGPPSGASRQSQSRESEKTEAEKETTRLEKKTRNGLLPCERTLGVHFARVALTHAPALPWDCHLEQLGAARRQELENNGVPVDASTLRALEMAEDFTRAKKDEAARGACCSCSARLQPPTVKEEEQEEVTALHLRNREARDWYSRGILDFEEMMNDVQHFLARDRRRTAKQEKGNPRNSSQSDSSSGGVDAGASGTRAAADGRRSLSPSPAPLSESSPLLDSNNATHESAARTSPQPHSDLFSSSAAASCCSVQAGEGKRTRGGEKSSGSAPLNLSEFYFYQAADGQLCFLHPFFIKCLLLEAGGDEKRLPPVLRDMPVQEVQPLCVDEQLRRRFKCLAHLPQMAQVSLVDVDLRSVLSPETARVFKEDFRRRAANRRERLRQEEREAAATASSVASLASSLSSALPRMRLCPAEPQHPPTDCSPSTFPSLPGQGPSGAVAADSSSPAASFAAVVKRQEEQRRARANREQFPSLAGSLPATESASPEISVARGVWQKPSGEGRSLHAKATASGERRANKKEEEVADAYAPRPGGCSLGEILLAQSKAKKKKEKAKPKDKVQGGNIP